VKGVLVPRVDLSPGSLQQVDAVVLVTDHSDVDYASVVRHAPLILDTRNALKGYAAANVVRL